MAVGGTNGCWTIWRLRLLAARADLYKRTNGCWAIWRLGHLAVGTFGGRDIWRSGPKRSQMGCWDMGQMAVGTFDGQEICYKGPNGC